MPVDFGGDFGEDVTHLTFDIGVGCEVVVKIYEGDADGSGFRVLFDGVAQREAIEAVSLADPSSHGDTVDSMS